MIVKLNDDARQTKSVGCANAEQIHGCAVHSSRPSVGLSSASVRKVLWITSQLLVRNLAVLVSPHFMFLRLSSSWRWEENIRRWEGGGQGWGRWTGAVGKMIHVTSRW